MIRSAITTALKDQGISQRRCALACNIVYQSFNAFIKGRRRSLPVPEIEKILNYLKLQIKNE